MTHAAAPLSVEGRRRLIERCTTRPIAHVAAETGISRACSSTHPRRRWAARPRTWLGPSASGRTIQGSGISRSLEPKRWAASPSNMFTLNRVLDKDATT